MALGGLLAVSRSPLPPRRETQGSAGRRPGGDRGRRGMSRAMKTFRWSIPLAVFVVLLAFLWVGLGRDPREVPSPLIGKPAPAFQLAQARTIRAKRLSNADLKGQVWLLNVWASWCVSCRVEHPLLVRARASRTSFPVYGLNYKDDPEAAPRLAREKRQSVHRVDRRPRRPGRHRLRRVRRAGDAS